jgi:hypothetical protein
VYVYLDPHGACRNAVEGEALGRCHHRSALQIDFMFSSSFLRFLDRATAGQSGAFVRALVS